MHLLRRRPVAIAYWLAAFFLSVWVGVLVSGWASDSAQTTGPDGEPTANGVQVVYGLVGFILGLLGVVAVFAAIWMVLWARERRRQDPEDDWDDSEMDDLLVDEDGEPLH
ncbi:hypothetical protein [Demetria terragena]|uniref:hypothetical protein n=1 Tax=Demetria terragena TaxID=63959 RepID=UPI00037EADD9|nr:hypothetical protein [Demetria terragena]